MTISNDNFIKLSFNSSSDNESLARVVMAAFLARLDPTVTELSDVKTVVSEAVTNAIIHGYNDDPAGKITLEANISGRIVTIRVRDYGAGIVDIAKVREPLYTSKPELERSGMGFTIMESFMDSLVIESKLKEGTTLTLTKTFEPKLVCAGASG